MANIITSPVTPAVEGVDVEQVRQAYWLLAHSGMSNDALQSFVYACQTDQCSACQKHWVRTDSPITVLPDWEYRFPRSKKNQKVPRPKGWPAVKLRSEVRMHLDDTERGVTWHNATTCPACLLVVADRMGQFVVGMPKQSLNVFCRTLAITIDVTKKEYEQDRWGVSTGRKFHGTSAYRGYVALVNACLQHLPHEGNARALESIVLAAKHLGML